MFDVGMGEFLVIALIAVLLLGPERLPKAVAEGAKWLRVLRDQAANARREISAAADLDPEMTAELRRTVSDLGDLHPKRLAASLLSDPVPGAPGAPATAVPPQQPVAPPVAAPAPAPVNSFGASAAGTSLGPRPADASAPTAMPPSTAAYDTDAT